MAEKTTWHKTRQHDIIVQDNMAEKSTWHQSNMAQKTTVEFMKDQREGY